MLGIKVSVPIACFRKGMSRKYLETDEIPPPSTCYGFLLSLVGETERERHLGARVAPVLLKPAEQSVVLRTVWKVDGKPLSLLEEQRFDDLIRQVSTWKATKISRDSSENISSVSDKPSFVGEFDAKRKIREGNKCPDFQQLLIDVQLLIWLDSSNEERPADSSAANCTLEERVKIALDPKRRNEIDRFGGLSLGESTHLVNDISLYYDGNTIVDKTGVSNDNTNPRVLCQDSKGLQTWPVWVDHVGAEGTRYVTGSLVPCDLRYPPGQETMPVIHM
ncbi:MAG: type I-MYXAN CRISPR-associated protein Cas5/Cmx5/DevS [Planctomycetia bacterium]|nr:type I-MYXAN CRISPR-associated protein Cas5/Cmx5/DevS [Planctomycetia bacterium]